MAFSTFSFPTRIHFGAGALAELPGVLEAAGRRRPLVVTDRGLVSSPIFERLRQVLNRAGMKPQTFSDISPNPTAPEVHEGGAFYKQSGADAIVAFGGGSALDAAKAVRLLATHDGSILDYEEAAGGTARIRPDMPLLVAIPTTAGTGSEVGRSTVITDPAARVKRIIFSPYLIASTVVADPELTYDLPHRLTAATGMDALTHCVESYLAKGYHPMCDAIALEGIRLISRNLPVACKEPANPEARAAMLMAAMMGAVAFQKGLGVTHSLAHPLTTLAGVHHGEANGIMLARAMEFNLPAAAERLADVARALDLASGAGREARAHAVVEHLQALAEAVGIPAHLSEVGVSRDLIEPLVAQAVEDSCHQLNPRPCSADDFRKLYEAAL